VANDGPKKKSKQRGAKKRRHYPAKTKWVHLFALFSVN
jgi:hypothetical protein